MSVISNGIHYSSYSFR